MKRVQERAYPDRAGARGGGPVRNRRAASNGAGRGPGAAALQATRSTGNAEAFARRVERWIIPDVYLASRVEYRRARTLVWATAILSAIFLFFISSFSIHGTPEGAGLAALLTALLVLLALPILRYTGSLRLAANWFLFFSLCALAIQAAFDGGIRDPAMLPTLFLPLLAALVLGLEGMVAWCAIVIGVQAGFFALHAQGYLLEQHTPEEVMRWYQVVLMAWATCLFGGVGWLYESALAREQARASNLAGEVERGRVRELELRADLADQLSGDRSELIAQIGRLIRKRTATIIAAREDLGGALGPALGHEPVERDVERNLDVILEECEAILKALDDAKEIDALGDRVTVARERFAVPSAVLREGVGPAGAFVAALGRSLWMAPGPGAAGVEGLPDAEAVGDVRLFEESLGLFVCAVACETGCDVLVEIAIGAADERLGKEGACRVEVKPVRETPCAPEVWGWHRLAGPECGARPAAEEEAERACTDVAYETTLAKMIIRRMGGAANREGGGFALALPGWPRAA